MVSFKALVIHDPHLTHESPPAYKIDYWPLMKSMLEQVRQWGKKQGAHAVLWTGDVFHRKAPTSNPIWFVNEVLDEMNAFQAAGMRNLGIAGNHDVKYGTWELGLKGQPLETLIKADAYQLLDQEPYRKDGTLVCGQSYHHGRVRNWEVITGSDYTIALGHFWFGPASGQFFGEPVYGPDVLGKMNIDAWCVGHHHQDQGHQTVDGTLYLVHGSFTRTGAHEHDVKRRPAVGWIEVDGKEVATKIIRTKFPIPEESMDLEAREEVRKEKEELDRFIDQLQTGSLEEIPTPEGVLKDLEITQEVRERSLEYLEKAEAL